LTDAGTDAVTLVLLGRTQTRRTPQRNHRWKAIGKRDIEGLHASLKSAPYHSNRVLSLLYASALHRL